MGLFDWIRKKNKTGVSKSTGKGVIKDSRPTIGNYNDFIKKGLRRAGIPIHRDFDVLRWGIGDDFFDLSIHLWPERITERHGTNTLMTASITDTVYELAKKWLKSHNP